ncbi:MAG: two-component system response regulator [Chloroflexota bacterium]
MKIFIIDDDEISIELSRIILNMSDVEDVDYRGSGREAIKYLDDCFKREAFPDLIFLDINLPGMDGFAFISHYEAHYKNFFPDTGIVLLTNSVTEDDRYRAENYDSVIDFMSKPLTSNNLDELMKTLRNRS